MGTGNGIEEYQASLASIAAARAYVPDTTASSSEAAAPMAGISLRTNAGALFAGSAIGTRRGLGAVSPLGTALVSLYANGVDAIEIQSAAWSAASPDAPEAERLRRGDAKLLEGLVPSADFREVPFVHSV